MALSISPTPWILTYSSRMIVNQAQRLAMVGGANHVSNASAIITAVNNSYGENINPEVVPEMRDTLQFAANAIWQDKYNEAIKDGSNDAAAKNYAYTHPDYLKVTGTLTKAATF